MKSFGRKKLGSNENNEKATFVYSTDVHPGEKASLTSILLKVRNNYLQASILYLPLYLLRNHD